MFKTNQVLLTIKLLLFTFDRFQSFGEQVTN